MEQDRAPQVSGRAVIAGGARDISQYFDLVFDNINRLARMFDDYRVVVVSDPSDDDTLERLREQVLNHGGKMVLVEGERDRLDWRAHRIAEVRNDILKVVEQQFADFDWLFMVDLDVVCHRPILLDTIASHLHRDDWDALTFNRHWYYDMWALSFEPHLYPALDLKLGDKGKRRLANEARENLLAQIDALEPGALLPVYSAFNGFGIYRVAKVLGCRYHGYPTQFFPPQKYEQYCRDMAVELDPDSGEMCEHLAFHWDMVNKHAAKIRLSPERAFLFPDQEEEHTQP